MTTTEIEQSKLIVSIVAPLVTLLGGAFLVNWLLHRAGKRYESSIWINQKLIEKRIAVFDLIARPINKLYCFYTRRGGWKTSSPAEVIQIKRDADETMWAYFPLFTEATFEAYQSLLGAMFATFTGEGHDAKLKLDPAKYAGKVAGWDPSSEAYFTVPYSETPDIHERYRVLTQQLAREMGVPEPRLRAPPTLARPPAPKTAAHAPASAAAPPTAVPQASRRTR